MIKMIGSENYQNFWELDKPQLRPGELMPGMVVGKINITGPATEFDMADPSYEAHPVLILERVKSSDAQDSVVAIDLNVPSHAITLEPTKMGELRHKGFKPWQWSQFYDLGIEVPATPLSVNDAEAILRATQVGGHDDLFREGGVDVARSMALRSVAELSILAHTPGLARPTEASY